MLSWSFDGLDEAKLVAGESVTVDGITEPIEVATADR